MTRVRAAWTASYPDPIRVAADDPVTLTGREDFWHGYRWLWAIAPDGRQGWVPDDLIVEGRATRNYSAAELTCTMGEALTRIETRHGWALCQNAAGQVGWVPLQNLSNAAGVDPR